MRISTEDYLSRFRAACETAAKTPVGQRMLAEGFKVEHAGGGCMAWEKPLPSGHYFWICDEGNGLGDTFDEPYLVGNYAEDGETYEQSETLNLEQAIAWCAERAADPQKFIDAANTGTS